MTREKSVLCFGDSNTWGYIPLTAGRLLRAERWPGILQKSLGDSYYVIEEGLQFSTNHFEMAEMHAPPCWLFSRVTRRWIC